MRPFIDPTVDFAFKLILGATENTDLLTHFLNSVVRPAEPIVEVVIENPFVKAHFEDQRQTIVDVLAADRTGRTFQIEVQVQVRPTLRTRMLHDWAHVYTDRVRRGEDDSSLRPVIAIWILGESLQRGCDAWHHRFAPIGCANGCRLSNHQEIHTLELPKLRLPGRPLDGDEQWAYFFRDAHGWQALPNEISAPEIKKAMSILDRIAERTEDYQLYRARERWEREQRTIEALIAQERAGKEAALAEVEQERAAKEQERAAKEQERAAKEQERAAKEQALASEARARAEAAALLDEKQALLERLRAAGLEP